MRNICTYHDVAYGCYTIVATYKMENGQCHRYGISTLHMRKKSAQNVNNKIRSYTLDMLVRTVSRLFLLDRFHLV